MGCSDSKTKCFIHSLHKSTWGISSVPGTALGAGICSEQKQLKILVLMEHLVDRDEKEVSELPGMSHPDGAVEETRPAWRWHNCCSSHAAPRSNAERSIWARLGAAISRSSHPILTAGP